MQPYLQLLSRILDEGAEQKDRTGVGTLSVVRASMMRSQNGLSSLSTAAGLSFIATNELRGTPPHFLFQGSHVTMESSS